MTPEEATQLVRANLGAALPRRFAHVLGVGRRAEAFLPLCAIDEQDLLISACLLHDIGYAPSVNKTGFHALDGARYLRGLGIDWRLCALVACHSCATIEAGIRGLSVELAEWPDESTPVRDALWWADMTTSPDGEPVAFEDRLDEIRERYGPEDVVTSFIRQAQPELRAAVERTEQRLRAAGISYE